jgi:hypothetical protein
MAGVDVLRQHAIKVRQYRTKFVAKFTALIFCIALASAPTSSQEIKKSILVQGKVDGVFFEHFQKSALSTDHIVFTSMGGDARTAIKIAKYLQTGKRLKTSVGGLCLSVCAEILFPAAMKFSDFSLVFKPLIGFHYNSEIIRRSLRTQDTVSFEKCWGILNDDFLRFMDAVGRSSESINSQITALAVAKESAVITPDCASSRVRYARRYWFPTSKQLSSLFSAGDFGPVCADDASCFTKSLLVLGRVNDSFLVGNIEYKIMQDANGKKIIRRGEQLDLQIL